MIKINKAIIITLVLGIFVLSGCAYYKQSRVEREWGNAFNAAKVNQIINIDTGKTLPITGIDGKMAEVTVQKYNKSGGSDVSKKPAIDLGKTTTLGTTAPMY